MTTVSAHQTAADLLSAANYIDTVGWVQGQYVSDNGAVCAARAIDVATEGHLGRCCHALRVVEEHVGILHGQLSGWNDNTGRTKEQVTTAFREAAEAVFPS